MKKLSLLICCLVIAFSGSLFAQKTTLTQFIIPGGGASVYLPDKPSWTIDSLQDNVILLHTELHAGDDLYGVSLTRSGDRFKNDPDDWKSDLEEEMNLLSEMFLYIDSPSEIQEISLPEGSDSCMMLSMSGEDGDGKLYVINGWINANFKVLLYVSDASPTEPAIQKQFLTGFKVP